MADEMDQLWKMPDHIPSDQYSLWAVERIYSHLFAECKRLLDGSVGLSDACKMLRDIMQPMRQRVEEQGLDGFGAFVARHSVPRSDYGSHPLQPTLSEEDAKNWWSSKTPRERYIALTEADLNSIYEVPDIATIGFDKSEQRYWRVSVSTDWEEIDDDTRAKLLTNMRRGWVNMPETLHPS